MECNLGRITVHYETFGKGRPIVMLHGWPLDHTEIAFEMEPHFARRQGWRRIYPDLPGMGKTPAADWISSSDLVLEVVESFIDKIVPKERFVAAGTSYGAYLARGLVYRRGPFMDGLLLSVPAIVYPVAKRILPPSVTLLKDQTIFDQARSENNPWLEDAAVIQNRETLEYARVLNATKSDKKFIEKLGENRMFSFDVDALRQPFPAPTLFIMGRQDSGNGYRDAWGILENYPRATFAVLDRAGHMALREQSELSSALISEWLNRVEEWASSQRS